MKNIYKILVLSASIASLSACSGYALQQAQKTSVSGNDVYQNTLNAEYLSLAKIEFEEGDYADSDFFSNRAMIVAGGKILSPDKIETRKLPTNKVAELRAARERFVSTYTGGASKYEPVALAKAHASFDCWIQEQEENFQLKDIENCRNDFEHYMSLVDNAKPKKIEQLMALKSRTVMVYFDNDNASLNSEAGSVIAEVANILKKSETLKVSVKGYTDTTGSDDHNTSLAQKRTNVVVDEFSSYGIISDRVTAVSFGEHNLAIPTADEVIEPLNRRTEIIFDVYEAE